MKHKNSKSDFLHERICDLMRAYNEYMASCTHIRMPDVYAAIVNMPSKRFWVSDSRTAIVIRGMKKGVPVLDSMWPLRKEMYEEIYRRVIALAEKHPKLSVETLCTVVVSQPAPKFYLSPGSAKVMICKARKQWTKIKLESMRRALQPR